MALELRPNCEYCDKDLPADAEDACICTYECTFCRTCVDGVLQNVCPNCGGGFVPRPIRPKSEWREGTSRLLQPGSEKRRRLNYSKENIAAHVHRIKKIAPEDR